MSAFAWENVAHGANDYPEWLKIEHRLRKRLTRLLNAHAGSDLALAKNTSETLSFIALGLDQREGDQVVIDNEGLPSNRMVWEALRPRGAKVVEVGLAGDDPEGALFAAYGPRTRLLSTSAVQCVSGLCLDLERIGTGCHRRGVLFCIDTIQQLGALPFGVQAYDCAFAMADEHKWMLGPEELGVFYCHPKQRECLALHEYDWHILEHTLDHERHNWRPVRSARRFECGSPDVLDTTTLEASPGLLEEIGMKRVGRDIAECVQWLQNGLSGIPEVRLHSPRGPSRRAGILTFSLDGQDSRTLFETSRQGRVICTQRGGGIRFSPHFYTGSTMIGNTLTILRQVAGTQVLKDGEGIPSLFKRPPALSGRPTNIINTERYWRTVSSPEYPASEGTEEYVLLFRS